MSEWVPIRREKPEVHGVDPNASGLIVVLVGLTPRPDDRWSDMFREPVGVSMSVSMHPPELTGDTVRLRAPDAELENYVQQVDDRIRSANERYAAEILPQLQRAEQQQQADREEQQRRVAEATERLKDL